MTIRRKSSVRSEVFRAASLALAGIAAVNAPQAFAAEVSVVSLANYYGYTAGQTGVSAFVKGGNSEQIYAPQATENGPTELGLDYTAYANNNGFYFLHQDYCIGTCSVYSSTRIEFLITNNTSQAENLRFDSFTTPGHMTLFQPNSGSQGSFDFTISQSVNDTNTQLYRADGVINDGIELRDDAQNFVDIQRSYTASGAMIAQWGVTPINLDLGTIAANSSTTLVYDTTYYVQNTGQCLDLETCSALEVRFGDPRNNGGAMLAAFASLPINPIEPQVGGDYDPMLLTFAVVDASSPLPPAPPRTPPVDFTGLNQPHGSSVSAVPEPSTWMSLLIGMFLVGGGLRHRRRTRAFV